MERNNPQLCPVRLSYYSSLSGRSFRRDSVTLHCDTISGSVTSCWSEARTPEEPLTLEDRNRNSRTQNDTVIRVFLIAVNRAEHRAVVLEGRSFMTGIRRLLPHLASSSAIWSNKAIKIISISKVRFFYHDLPLKYSPFEITQIVFFIYICF